MLPSTGHKISLHSKLHSFLYYAYFHAQIFYYLQICLIWLLCEPSLVQSIHKPMDLIFNVYGSFTNMTYKMCFFLFLLLLLTWKHLPPELSYPAFDASKCKVVNMTAQQDVTTDTCQQLVPNSHTRLLASWLWAAQPMTRWKSTLATCRIERLLLTACLRMLPLMNMCHNCALFTVQQLPQPKVQPGIMLSGVSSHFGTIN